MLLIFELGGRRVKVEPVEVEDGCPACGVVSCAGARLGRGRG